jgi:hypothetical protein
MNNPALQIVDLVTTDEDKRFEPVGRMATAIIEITQKNGGCLPQDLNEKGFTPAEVAQHYHMAKSLAAVELKLMNENPIKPKSLLRRI